MNKLLKKKNNELTDDEMNNKLDFIEKKRNIQEEIEDLKKGTDKNNYLLNTSHMLFNYFDDSLDYDNTNKNEISKNTNSQSSKRTVIDFFSKEKEKDTLKINNDNIIPKNNKEDKPYKVFKDKKDIMHQYFSIVNDNYVPTKIIDHIELDNCSLCNESRIFDSIHGLLICPICGDQEKILVDSDTPSYKEPPREITYFAYKKINHANEFLSQFQAKESTDIDNQIFEKILEELKKETYLDIKKITPNKIREILKKLELTKYYEHCHYITNRLTGKPAPTLDSILEEKLRNMFKEVQGPWMNYCPNERANFFSYPYIFYKFFQLLDKDEYLPYCRLLKSREKLQEHDEVWRKICKHLKWQFIPTV